MKRESDLEKGEKWRVNVDCAFQMELSKCDKRYIKIISGDAEIYPAHKKSELNNIQNRTDRIGRPMGLTRKFINITNGSFKLIEYRRPGDNFLKVPSEIQTIDQAWLFFKNRYFLVVDLDNKDIPIRFSRLVLIDSMNIKKWGFDKSKGNETRINIDDFDKYFLYRYPINICPPKGFFTKNKNIINQLDLLLKL